MPTPAGWYADPAASGSVRWWDGAGWTEHTAPAVPDTASPEVPPTAPSADAATPSAPLVPENGGRAARRAAAEAATPAPPAREPRSWLRPVVAGLLAAAVLGAGWYAWTTLNQPPDTPLALPRGVSTAPPAPIPNKQVTLSIESFKPADLPGSGRIKLVTAGGAVTGTTTMSGWCTAVAASDKQRTDRRHWGIYQGAARGPVTVEAVAYRTPAAAKAAIAGFVKATSTCRNVPRRSSGGSVVRLNRVTSGAFTPAVAGGQGYRATIKLTAPGGGSSKVVYVNAQVQQRGQFVSIVWTTQRTPFTARGLAAIDRVVRQQGAALDAAPSG